MDNRRSKSLIKRALRKAGNVVGEDLGLQQLTVRCLESLSPLIANWAYLPMTDWAAGPIFYTHLLNEIVVNNRRHVIECGSGISTILIARLIKINDLKIKFVSIDHDGKWQDVVKNILVADKIDGLVNFVASPLANYDGHPWYDKEKLKCDAHDVDMLVVDGPISDSPMTRLGAVPHFLNNLSQESYAIFLHDTDRAPEKQIVAIWKKLLGAVNVNGFCRYTLLDKNSKYGAWPQTSF